MSDSATNAWLSDNVWPISRKLGNAFGRSWGISKDPRAADQGCIFYILRIIVKSPLTYSINFVNLRIHICIGKVYLIYKSNRKRFSCVCIAWYKHSRDSENSWQLCKPSTSSRVCTTVSNSPNPSRVYIRLCKHGKRFLLLKWTDEQNRGEQAVMSGGTGNGEQGN